MSPFTIVLKYYVVNHKAQQSNIGRTLLQPAIDDISLSAPSTTVSFLEILVSSLRRTDQVETESFVFEYLDECLVRLAKKPVKYYDDLMAIIYQIGSDKAGVKNYSIGLLLVVILEQSPYLVKSKPSHNLHSVTKWLTRYLNISMQAGENHIVLSYFRNQIGQQLSDTTTSELLQKSLEEPEQLCFLNEPSLLHGLSRRKVSRPTKVVSQAETAKSGALEPPSPPIEVDDEHDLTRWAKKDIIQATLDGDVGALALCLCSKYEEVRKQALNNLRIVLGKLEVGKRLFRIDITKESRNPIIASGNRRTSFLGKLSMPLNYKHLCPILQVYWLCDF